MNVRIAGLNTIILEKVKFKIESSTPSQNVKLKNIKHYRFCILSVMAYFALFQTNCADGELLLIFL